MIQIQGNAFSLANTQMAVLFVSNALFCKHACRQKDNKQCNSSYIYTEHSYMFAHSRKMIA